MASNAVLAKMAVYLSANTAEFNRNIAGANKNLASLTQAIGGTAQALGLTFGASQIFQGLKEGIAILADFEKQMDTVRAITQGTDSDIRSLEQSALALGRATQYTASQVAGLQIEYGRLGFSTAEILDSTKATINLATATGENLSRSAEIAGSTLRAFQLDASQMGRVTDVMASAFNHSALALDSFADGIKYVAPVAKATNVSLEQTSALLSVLADAGIKGSQAGTSLRRIFTLLTNDGRPFAARLQELADKGITLADANDEVGLYAQTALLVIAEQNEKVKELTKTYEGARGEAKKTADVMRDNLSGDITRLNNEVNNSILKFSFLIPVLRQATQALTEYVKSGGVGAGFGRSGEEVQISKVTKAYANLAEQIKNEVNPQVRKLREFEIKELSKTGSIDLTEEQFDELTKRMSLTTAQAVRLRMAIFNLGGVVGGRKAEDPLESTFGKGKPQTTKAPDRTIDFLQEQIKKLNSDIQNTTDSGVITKYQAQIDALKVEIEKLTGAYTDFERVRRISTLERDLAGPAKEGVDRLDESPQSGLSNPSSVEFLSKANDAFGVTLDNISAKLKKANKDSIIYGKSQENNISNALRLADSIGNAITNAIAYGETWEESFARVTVSIVDNLEQIALAWVIENAAELSNPFLIGAAIIVGSAIVKGAFGNVYKDRSSSSSSSVANSSRGIDSLQPQPVQIDVTGQLSGRGQDIIATIEKATYSKNKTGG